MAVRHAVSVAVSCIVLAVCGKTAADGGAWRKLADLPPVKAGETDYRFSVNLGRGDWWELTPLKVVVGDGRLGGCSFWMNDHPLAAEGSLPSAALVRRDDLVGEHTNALKIACAAAGAERAVTLWGRVPSGKGPRLVPLKFIAEHLDAGNPELSGAVAAARSGNEREAMRLFAAYVRGNGLRPGLARAAEPHQPDEAKTCALRTMDYTVNPFSPWGKSQVGACTFEGNRIEWQYNPMPNGYREWCFGLARFGFCDPVAEYYRNCGDERAARVWRDMVASFIEDEPVPPRGTNFDYTKSWRTLDCAIRLNALYAQFCVFAKSPELDDRFVTTLFASFWEHCDRLCHDHAPQGNWLVEEMSALTRFALACPFFAESESWLAAATPLLERELAVQVYPDGFQVELTPSYHGMVLSIYLGLIDLYHCTGREPSPGIRAGVERMLEPYIRLARPDGGVPPVNDSWWAMVPQTLLQRAMDAFPHRRDFRYVASKGDDGRQPEFLSTAMPWAGAVALRNSWKKDGVWAYMDASPVGMAHQHEDKLNVLLSAYGRNMLVEAGCYNYDNSDTRRYAVSTRGHNTVRIDGQDQCRIGDKPRRWDPADTLRQSPLSFAESAEWDGAAATYTDGYAGGVGRGVSHERSLYLHKGKLGTGPFVVVVDRLASTDGKQHGYEQIWHLEDCKLTLGPRSFFADFGGADIGLKAVFSANDGATLADMKGVTEPELQGWMPDVGAMSRRAIPTPVLSGRFTGGVRLVSVFWPVSRYASGGNRLVGVEASTSPDDKSYALVFDDGRRLEFEEPLEAPGVSRMLTAETTDGGPYGVCAHLTFSSGQSLWTKLSETAADIGFGFVRCDFQQPGPGGDEAQLRRFDRIVRESTRNSGVRLMGILWPPVQHDYAKLDSDGYEKWAGWVSNVVARYSSSIRMWEVTNEPPDHGSWNGKRVRDEYPKCQKIAYDVIKSIDPGITVSTAGFAGVPDKLIDSLYQKAGKDSFDTINFHWYNWTGSPEETLPDSVRKLRGLTKRHGDGDKPIWITEFGYATQKPSEVLNGVIKAGLRAVDPAKGDWKVWYVGGVPGERLRDERLLRGLGDMLPSGSSLRVVAPQDLASELVQAKPDAIVLPFTPKVSDLAKEPVLEFVRDGGTLIDLGGYPFSEKFRVTVPDWVAKNKLPPSVDVVPAEVAKDIVRKKTRGKRFMSFERLLPEDKLTVLAVGKTKPGEANVAAAAIRYGGDMKGALVVSSIAETQNWCPASEDEQAWNVARMASIAFNEGVEKVVLYALRNAEKDAYEREENFGVVHADFSPKPAAWAWRTFIERRPPGSVQLPPLPVKDDVWTAQWKRPDGTVCGVIWTTEPSRRVVLALAGGANDFRDHFGHRIDVATDGQKFVVDVAEAPIYFSGQIKFLEVK